MPKKFRFEEKEAPKVAPRTQERGGLIKLLLKLSFITSIKRAKVVLFILFVVLMGATFFMAFHGDSSKSPKDNLKPPRAVIQQSQR